MNCGCGYDYTESLGTPYFSMCKMHSVAPEMWAAIKYALEFSDVDVNPVIKKRLRKALEGSS